MAITVRDLKPGSAAAAAPRPPVKRNIASLVGGFVIALGCFVLWMLVASELTASAWSLPVAGAGAAFALAVGIWIRVADL